MLKKMAAAGWALATTYNSPPDAKTIDRNVMWMKHFIKGVAEGIPNIVWIMAFKALAKAMQEWQSKKVMEIDNLNQAYEVGREFGKALIKEMLSEIGG